MAGNKLEVVLTPALLPLYNLTDKVVVMIDILRASTSICVAFNTGVNKILPVSTPEEAKLFKEFDFVIAAERNAIKVDGFDLGNSPFEFENSLLKDRTIAFTTTNGTKALKMAREMGAHAVFIGSFLNLSALCDTLMSITNKDIILLCAGWKDKFNLEDTLFAGAVASRIQGKYEVNCDSALAAMQLYDASKNDLNKVVQSSSHAKRFKTLHAQTDDVSYCLQMDTIHLVPVMEGEYLVAERKSMHVSG